MACAAVSISPCVRATSVTSAPACASADAAARPMPRPPPVTSARLPSRRKEGVLAMTTVGARMTGKGLALFGRLGVGHIASTVAAHAHIGLLGMGGDALEHA